MGYKIVTIKDIAEQLQLTQATVSKALRNDDHVKKLTREKVIKIAEELGYNNNWRVNAAQRKRKALLGAKLPKLGSGEATIYDIAHKLRLSTATVSRALNGSDKVTEKTLKKVRDTASALGYIVNTGARDLRAKSTSPNQLHGAQQVTIYTIAEKLGISPSTVSRAFVKDSGVSAKTRASVLQTAKETGFVPDEEARKLRVNRSQTIGVVVSQIGSPEVQQIIAGIEETLQQLGYNLLITNVLDSSDFMLHKRILTVYNHSDGVLIIPAIQGINAALLQKQFGRLKPLVVLGSFMPGKIISRVTLNQFQAAYDLTAQLIRKGCRRIFYADPVNNKHNFTERLNGYIKAHREAKLPFDKTLVLNSNCNNFDGFCTSVLTKAKPDGLILIDHVLNGACLNMLEDPPNRPVKEIAYAEFEVGSLRHSTNEQLVKLRYNYFETGAVGARLLVNELIEASAPPAQVVAGHQLFNTTVEQHLVMH
jgi:LacI family transcriptional regulator